MSGREGLYQHLGHGITTVCHCWLVTRKDGETYGFTDHDRDLSFEGHVFKASSGSWMLTPAMRSVTNHSMPRLSVSLDRQSCANSRPPMKAI